MNKTKNLVYSAFFIALGIVLPIVFHAFGKAGNVLLPMHIPVLIAGMLLSPSYALMIGMVTPILSSVLTSMPPLMPMLPIMVFELGTYGFIAAIMIKRYKVSVIVALLVSMVIGRLVAGLVVYLMTTLFLVKMPSPIAFVTGAVATGLPGIVIQLILVPVVVYAIEKSKIIEK